MTKSPLIQKKQLKATKVHSEFFLTVIIRTQGKRHEAISDALLCLQAQTDTAFEVLIVTHDCSKDDLNQIKKFLSELASDFSSKIRVLSARGGTRSIPINISLLEASGTHIAVFDDDDLLFAHWVHEFHKAAISNPGKLLRAQVLNQEVALEQWPGGRNGFRTQSWPQKLYPEHFSLIDHLLVNYTPFMSVAFPRELFIDREQKFNEKLTVVEDWDMILRGALICGVANIPEVTSIYRQWLRTENSQTTHSLSDWKASEAIVISNLDCSEQTFPPGSVSRIQELLIKEEKLSNHSEAVLSTSLYVRKQGKRVVRLFRKAKFFLRKVFR
jgi:glycosyltransferase involved in cell wall biosynthesis